MYSSFDDRDVKSASDESEYKTYDDSDENEERIDSDIEAALYSQIHHQENPLYEHTVEETENLHANDDSNDQNNNKDQSLDDSNDQNNNKDQSLDSTLNKDSVTPFTITISDESDVCNVDDTNSSDIQFICETKKKINNENDCKIHNDAKDHQNKWWENFVSVTYNDDDDDGNKVLDDEKNPDDDKSEILTKLKQPLGLKAPRVVLPCKNKRAKKSSTSQVKGNAIKRATKRKRSSNSEYSFKHPQQKTEGKDVLINVKPSIVTVDLTEDNELWQLNLRDMYKNKQESRYYNKRDRIICNNCSERGHISRDCTMPRKLPICYLCGKLGHQGRYCLNPACSLCLSVGHSSQQCHWTDNTVEKCPVCNMMDHLAEDCPDKWRRYHMTVASGPIIYGNSCRNSTVYCYNCARKGHFGYECDRERMDIDTYPTSPFISQYCEPVIAKQKKRLLRLAKRKQNAVNKSNKQFMKRSKYLHNRSERNLKLALDPSSVTRKKPGVMRKKPKKKKNLFKNTSTAQTDSSLASSSQMSNIICSPPKKKRRKEKSVLQQTESHQKSKIKKPRKKKKKKLQNVNTKTELIQGNMKTESIQDHVRMPNGNSGGIAANILRALVPPELRLSMTCMNLFSGKRF